MRFAVISASLWTLLCVLLGGSLLAETSAASRGAIRGLVTDANHAPIAGVSIEAENTETGLRRTAKSNEEGYYSIADLPLTGQYRVKFEMRGLAGEQAENIHLNAGEVLAINAILGAQPGQSSVIVFAVADGGHAIALESPQPGIEAVAPSRTPGWNDFHGELYYAWRPGMEQAGAAVSGPLGRDRSNFLLSYDTNNLAGRNSVLFRLDQKLNDRNRLTFRANADTFNTFNDPFAPTGQNPALGWMSPDTFGGLRGHSYDASFSETALISPRVINDARLQYHGGAYQAGLYQGGPTQGGSSFAAFQPSGPAQYLGFDNQRRDTQFSDTVSLTRGAHKLKAGVDLGYSASPIAGQTTAGLFAEDSWKASRNLTLSLGLRYERQTTSGGRDNSALQPRVGFAWNPLGGKTAVRGAYAEYSSQFHTDDFARLDGVSKSKQGTFGIERELAKGWALSLMGTRQRASTLDRMLMPTEGMSLNGTPLNGKERYDALSTTLTKRFSSKGGVRMSHTLSHAEFTVPGWDGVTFQAQGPTQGPNQGIVDQRHRAEIEGWINFSPNWSVGTSMSAAAGHQFNSSGRNAPVYGVQSFVERDFRLRERVHLTLRGQAGRSNAWGRNAWGTGDVPVPVLGNAPANAEQGRSVQFHLRLRF